MAAPKAKKQEAQQPLILRAHRLMEAFAKSDDERDFYIDRLEGFILYIDLDKPVEDLEVLDKELLNNPDRYCMIPKLTFYEAKKIMEGFVNEKVYDIDTKEKLLDIIQAKEARSNFLEFVFDHHSEYEKWQQYYQERSRVRIIEWLRQHHFHFVFEEDLEFARSLLEKLKQSLFDQKAGKDVLAARKILIAKAKGYYSNEALNPRPKRGRPPKQITKQEIEPQVTSDLYITASPAIRPFLFIPDISSASAVTFSADFEGQGSIMRKLQTTTETDNTLASLQQKLAALRQISKGWSSAEKPGKDGAIDFEEDEEEDDDDLNGFEVKQQKPSNSKGIPAPSKKKIPEKPAAIKPKQTKVPEPKQKKAKAPAKPAKKTKPVVAKGVPGRKQKHKRIIPINKTGSKTKPKPLIKNTVKPKSRPIVAPKKPVAKPKAPIKKQQVAPKKMLISSKSKLKPLKAAAKHKITKTPKRK